MSPEEEMSHRYLDIDLIRLYQTALFLKKGVGKKKEGWERTTSNGNSTDAPLCSKSWSRFSAVLRDSSSKVENVSWCTMACMAWNVEKYE